MNHINVAEYDLRKHTSDQSFRRGEEYFQHGAVRSVVREGDLIHAEVSGSAPWPYQVQTEWVGGRLTKARCDCPYGFGDYCKHIVAAALTVLRQPDRLEERQPLDELLRELSRDQLHSILLDLAGSSPANADRIRNLSAIAGASGDPDATSQERPARYPVVDPAMVRRLMHEAFGELSEMRPYDAYWHVPDVAGQIAEIFDLAPELARVGRGEEALQLLEVVTREYVANWGWLDDPDGESSSLLWDLGDCWAEVLLMLDLTSEQREDLVQQIDEFSAELMDFGVEDAFFPALDAAEQGWEVPDVQAAMRGEVLADNQLPADPLIPIRLKVLALQERYDEFLNLALASERFDAYLIMLVSLDRIDEAVERSVTLLPSADAAFQLVNLVQERGTDQQALEIGRHGLTLPGDRHYLASWVRDKAAQMGDRVLALRAAVIAFETSPSLEAYLLVQEHAGAEWPAYREQLLEHARNLDAFYKDGAIEVFLHEGLVADAIRSVETSFLGGRWIAVVAQAAVDTDPDWVIRNALSRADGIMDAGQSSHYQEAAEWMDIAKSAFQSAGRHREWSDLLSERLERHQRKYKLRPLLEQLVD